MSDGVNLQTGGLGQTRSDGVRGGEVEAMDPSEVSVKGGGQAQEATSGSPVAKQATGPTIADVLKDPTSTAHSFMEKAQACHERGDLQGYFAYHDHAMTWAQTEAAARSKV